MIVLLASGCTSVDGLQVMAASSLTEALQSLPADDPPVRFQFAGSQIVAAQVRHGAPVDAVVLADAELVDQLRHEGLVGTSRMLAHNRLVVVSTSDVTFPDLVEVERVVLGTATSPIGRYTDAAVSQQPPAWQARLETRVVSRESNVRLVLNKVLLGEADAAVVYASDVRPPLMAHPVPHPAVPVLGAAATEAGEGWLADLDGRVFQSAGLLP